MVGKCSSVQAPEFNGVIQYAHSAAVTAWTPIAHSILGVLIACVSAAVNVSTQYYSTGVFRFKIGTAVSVSQGDILFYDTDNDYVVKAAPTNGFRLGIAVADGTATAGYVDVLINRYNLASNVVTSGKVVSSGGQIIGKKVVADAADTAPTLTAAQIFGGLVLGTPTAARNYTLCTATDLMALIPGGGVGSTVRVSIKNLAAATHAITVVATASITNGGIAGDLTVSAATVGTFDIVFTSATAAVLYRVNN